MQARDLEEALEMGMDWSLREGYIWAEDKEHCEEYGRMLQADPNKVSTKAKKRGLPQLGTLGAGKMVKQMSHGFRILWILRIFLGCLLSSLSNKNRQKTPSCSFCPLDSLPSPGLMNPY